MHSPQLAEAINNIELKKYLLEYGLKADQQYLVCKTMGTKLPLLLVVEN
jgi:hypothetical protein